MICRHRAYFDVPKTDVFFLYHGHSSSVWNNANYVIDLSGDPTVDGSEI